MEGDEHAVCGGVGVGLQVAVAEGDRGLERLHGVLAAAPSKWAPWWAKASGPGQSRKGKRAIDGEGR